MVGLAQDKDVVEPVDRECVALSGWHTGHGVASVVAREGAKGGPSPNANAGYDRPATGHVAQKAVVKRRRLSV